MEANAAQLLLDAHFSENAKSDNCDGADTETLQHKIMPSDSIDMITNANRTEWALISFDNPFTSL